MSHFPNKKPIEHSMGFYYPNIGGIISKSADQRLSYESPDKHPI